MTMRVPEKRAGLSLPEYRRQSGYTAGSGLSARADDAFVEIRARAEEDEREAAGRFAVTAGRAVMTAAQAWDDYQTSRATQAFNAFQTTMQERMYGEDGIFTRQGEAAFSSAEDLEAAMRESVQELSQSMDLNPLARVKLARQVFAFGNQALPRARKYAADQRLNWANGQDMASIELNQEAFLNNADDSDARMLNLNTMRESYERYAARNGLSEEEKTLGWKKIQSGAYGRLADKYISEGNLSAARRLAEEEALWVDGEQSRLWAKITRQEDILRAQAEAQRQEKEWEAVRSLRQEILDETAAFPTLEEQQAAALARAESLEDPKLREKVRAGIVREMDWRIRRRDAEIMRTGLEFRRAAREEGLSPEEQLARLEETDIPPYVRAPLESELESGTQRLPNEENMSRAMTLLRLIDASRAGGMSPAGGSSPSREDILAAALYGGLTDGQTEGVLAYLEKGNWLPISRLDDICLELGMPPDERGQVLAPAWLYEGVLRETAQSGNSLSDEELKKITTRVWQRHSAYLAALGGTVVKTAATDVSSSAESVPAEQPRSESASSSEERGLLSFLSTPLDAFGHGFQNSVSGLWLRRKEPDMLTPQELENLNLFENLVMSIGQTIGDIPTLAVGALIGAQGGPLAPVIVPATAMGLTEGTRSVLQNEIRLGPAQSLEDFAERAGDNLMATGKGTFLGGMTGGAGTAAGAAVRAVGGRAVAQQGGRLAAETVTLPTAAAAMEGRLPEAQDFADAVTLILGMKGLGSAGKGAAYAFRGGKKALEARLRTIYEQTGTRPEQVLLDAARNPDLQAELASGKQEVPSYYTQGGKSARSESDVSPVLAKPVLEKAKAGEYIDTETLVQLAGPRPWAQALLNERLGMGRLKEKLAVIFDRAERKDLSTDALPWQFVTTQEAALLSEKTGLKIEGGFTHAIAPQQVWHAVKRHGKDGESFLDYPNQIPLTRDDIAMLPELIRPENIVRGAKSKSHTPLIVYKKITPDGFTLYYEEVRTKRKQLAFKTMYKVKK